MTFVEPQAYQPPPTFIDPPSGSPVAYDDAKGVVVIESDDGNLEDYTVWLALFRRRSQQVTPFAPYNEVRFSPCVNSASIGNAGKMTEAMLQTMQREGHEIQSHGRHHRTIGEVPLASNAAQGATVLSVTGPGKLGTVSEGYAYTITNGLTTEAVTFTSVGAATQAAGPATLAAPLTHAYDAGAVITMTEESVEALLQGCVDDLAGMGIECRNHAYAWYESTAASRGITAGIFDSSRGYPSGVNVPSAPRSLYELGYKELTSASLASIEADLDTAAAEGGVYIFMGHAETDAANLAKLDHLVTEAWARGMRIVTRAQALEHMASW